MEFQKKEAVKFSVSMLSGLCLFGRPLKVRAGVKTEPQLPAQASVELAEDADLPQPPTASSPMADERDATIEAKLQEQFGSRLSSPAPPTKINGSNPLDSQPIPARTFSNGIYSEEDEKAAAVSELPSSISSCPSVSSLPSLPLFPPGLPLPPVLPLLPIPPPGIPPFTFPHHPLPPPHLPLPSPLFPTLVTAPQRDPPPPKDLLSTTPSIDYNYERHQQVSGLSALPSPREGQLASHGTITPLLPDLRKNLFKIGIEQSHVDNSNGDMDSASVVESSSQFVEDNCVHSDMSSQFLEQNYIRPNGVEGDMDCSENVENHAGLYSDGLSRNEANYRLSYLDDNPSYRHDSQKKFKSANHHRSRLRQNNQHHGRHWDNHRNRHELLNPTNLSECHASSESSHAWHDHPVHSSIDAGEITESRKLNLKRLQDLYKALKAMQPPA